MADDLSIPSPTYRIPRQRRRMDPGTRKLALIAAVIGGGLIVIVAGWNMVSRQGGGVPIIQAQPGPMRVKPANPGGLQVQGLGNDIFSGASDTDVQKLAPGPQTPDPQALQAMAPPPAAPKQAAAKAAAPAGTAAAAAAAGTVAQTVGTPGGPMVAAAAPAEGSATAPLPAPPAVGAPMAVPPVTAPIAASPAPAVPQVAAVPARPAVTAAPPPARSVAAPLPAAAAGPVMVQLAALASEQEASNQWAWLVRRWPAEFRGRQAAISRTQVGGHVFWRLRTGGFADRDTAAAFCRRLRGLGAACFIADF